MSELLIPQEPVRIALVGTGSRSQGIYCPLLSSLKPWVKVVAVCDPVREHADAMANALGVPAFYDIRELVRVRPMEAALVVTPVESHHAISMYLSSNGIHNQPETTWCSMVSQARQMIETARQHGVVVRVGENFFREPFDRIVQELMASNVLGKVSRIVSYDDAIGYHNCSRWIVMAKSHPLWVQAMEHTMPTITFRSAPVRLHESETYRANFFMFPGNLLVLDHAANAKGFLGRHPRPGYTEWQGEQGTIVYRADPPRDRVREVRYCSKEAAQRSQELGKAPAMDVHPIVEEVQNSAWIRSYVDLPSGRIEYVNHLPSGRSPGVMGHIVDFSLAVRGLAPSEFSEQDAMMSLMMEIGARESVRQEGRRIALPLEGEVETDQIIREDLRKRYGVDPLDVEAMLSISYPTP